MLQMRFNNPIRPNRFHRGIAIFFLVFAFIDLVCPGLCQADFADPGAQRIAQLASDTKSQALVATGGPQHERDSHSQTLEEDCFCCCPHLQPSFGLIAPVINVKPSVLSAPLSHLPTAPPTGTDHPPRLISC